MASDNFKFHGYSVASLAGNTAVKPLVRRWAANDDFTHDTAVEVAPSLQLNNSE